MRAADGDEGDDGPARADQQPVIGGLGAVVGALHRAAVDDADCCGGTCVAGRCGCSDLGERCVAVSMMETYRVRHAVRDVGAALGLPPGEVDDFAKAFPHIRANQVHAALKAMSHGLAEKPFCHGIHFSLADVADNFLVIAWTDQEKKKARDHSGLSAFIVERAFPGFSSYTMKEKWGILAGNTGGFHMSDVRVPAANLVGREGEGFKVAMFALENGRYTVAAGATGLIRACLDASVKYSKDRKTFGVSIAEHQLVKEMIAEMVSDYDAARLLWLRAGWLKNEGKRNTRETGLAKWFSTVKSERAASDCVQIHGGNGFSDEYPAGRFFRNSKAAVIYEGTREIHKLMQADYALGFRQDKPRRVELPAWRK